MYNYVFCICSKNPTSEYLLKNISLLNMHYVKPKIHIIDSASTQISGYNIINNYNNVELHYANNVNYELGAWKYAINNIPAVNYIFIQDTLFLIKKVNFDFNKNDLYYFNVPVGWKHCFDDKCMENEFVNSINFLTKDTVYYEKCWRSWINREKQFDLITHTSFGVKRSILKNILSNLNNLPTEKIHSITTERLMYWIFLYHTVKCVPLEHISLENGIWDKKHGGRE